MKKTKTAYRKLRPKEWIKLTKIWAYYVFFWVILLIGYISIFGGGKLVLDPFLFVLSILSFALVLVIFRHDTLDIK